MNKEILNTGILSIAFLALFGLGELLYHFAHLKAELTRKIVHVLSGVLTLLLPVMLKSHFSVLFLCISFELILFASLRYGLLPSINNIGRKSAGSLCFPLAIYLCFVIATYYKALMPNNGTIFWYYIPVLVLAICDPVAALAGRKFPYGRYKSGGGNKTFSGSLAFFVSAFFIILILTSNALNNSAGIGSIVFFAIILAALSTTTEAITGKGYDNLTVPLTILCIMYLVLYLKPDFLIGA